MNVFFVGERHYRIEFAHEKEKRETFCFLYRDWALISSGMATCAPSDNFCKSTGRRIAMTRALKSFPREERRAIWTTYLNQRGGKC